MKVAARRRSVLLGAALLVAALGAFCASRAPDTLEYFLGRSEVQNGNPIPAPLPDYQVPGVEQKGLSRLLAGTAGVLATFGVVTLLSTILSARRGQGGERASPNDRAP